MQLGLTWPLQRLLRTALPYGAPIDRGFCWDAHCITLRGHSSLLLVHCESRYTCVRFDLTPADWARLPEIAGEEIALSLIEDGVEERRAGEYLSEAGAVCLTRTHGRREVAFLNRAWEDVLSLDLLVDEDCSRQPILNHAVNQRLCCCAGEEGVDTAQAHLLRYFDRFSMITKK